MPTEVPSSLTVKLNATSLSAARSLTTRFVTTISPVLRVLMKVVSLGVLAMLPVYAPCLIVVKLLSAVSVTVYLTLCGKPLIVRLSPCLSGKVATPDVNEMPPAIAVPFSSSASYDLVIFVSPSVTLKVNARLSSLSISLTTVLLTLRSPFSRVFVNVAVLVLAAIVPVSSVLSVVIPATEASLTMYSRPWGRPLKVLDTLAAVSLLVRVNVATPLLNWTLEYFLFTLSSATNSFPSVCPSLTVNVYFLVLSAYRSLTTFLVTVSFPVLRVFVNDALDSVPLMVPDAPVTAVEKSESVVSLTVYPTPTGRSVAWTL